MTNGWSLGRDRLHEQDVCMANVCVTLGTMCASNVCVKVSLGTVCTWLMSVSYVGLWAGIAYMGTVCMTNVCVTLVTCRSLGSDRLHGHDVCRILRVRGGEQTQPERRADCCPWTRTQVSPPLPLLQTSALLSPFVCEVLVFLFCLFIVVVFSSLHSERCYLPSTGVGGVGVGGGGQPSTPAKKLSVATSRGHKINKQKLRWTGTPF